MPRKRAPAKTGRPPAIPYDLRKSHIPRIPHPGDAGSGEDPTGGYIPAAAKKQIETMQERQASFQRHQGVESVEYAISEDHRGWQAGVLFWQ